jgi:hypothetical protein
MLIVREIMHCKPGKVKPMVEKFIAMQKLMDKAGVGKMRVMTDVSADRYWTVVAEFEAPSLGAFEQMMAGQGPGADQMKEMDNVMKGYHELVDHGRREIYKVEG